MISDYGRGRNARLRREKTRRAREQFMIFVLLLALIPTILCVVLFTKQAQLRGELDTMEQKLERYEKNGPGSGQSGVLPVQTPEPTPTQEATPTPVNKTAAGNGEAPEMETGQQPSEPPVDMAATPFLSPTDRKSTGERGGFPYPYACGRSGNGRAASVGREKDLSHF